MTGFFFASGLVGLVALPGCLEAQSSCLTNPDTAASYVADIKHTLTWGDSAGVIRSGMPYKPEHVTLVTSEADCLAAISTINAQRAGTIAPQVSRTYLFSVEKSGYAMVPADPTCPSECFTYLDRAFHILFHIGSLN